MKNQSRHPGRRDVELLIVETFRAARVAMDAFERLAMAAWRCSSERDGVEQGELATVPPEVAERDGILACTVNEACRRTGVGRTRIYQAIGSGELRALKCGNRTLIDTDSIRRWIASLPTVTPRQPSVEQPCSHSTRRRAA
jgi:excisionase family DNA binding protein